MANLKKICIDTHCSDVTGAEYTAGQNITISDQRVISAIVDLSNYYNKVEVDELIADVSGIRMEVVDSLPATGEGNVIYLVENSGGTYDQWVYTTEDGWVQIGSTGVDLSGYLKKENLLVTAPVTKTVSGNDVTIGVNLSGYTKTDNILATAPITRSVSGNNVTVAHANSGVGAGAKGETGNKTPAFGATFKVPSFTVDAKGHVTVAADHTVKIPNNTATTSAAGLMGTKDKQRVDWLPSASKQVRKELTSKTIKKNESYTWNTSKGDYPVPTESGYTARAISGFNVGNEHCPVTHSNTAGFGVRNVTASSRTVKPAVWWYMVRTFA